ncbi:PQQ-binding-like beta-propeller repeat protein [Haloarcula saliterrae]|uniref:outer membrane protein assembly factor BamB family protein n=1 Tax=Haloarcula saliterrae TaxID=2950534 RepID=UPI00287B7390|nr:PQQ-binding-like beta-propeller repeat protein [Haloarcula sp. S1CR25-12]
MTSFVAHPVSAGGFGEQTPVRSPSLEADSLTDTETDALNAAITQRLPGQTKQTPVDPANDSTLDWRFDESRGPIESSPTVIDGTAYVGTNSGTVYAVDADTGEREWAFDASAGAVTGSPAVDNGVVYAGSHDGTLYAIDADTGEEKWRFEQPSSWIYGSPTVKGGSVYVAGLDATVYSVDTGSGALEWRFDGVDDSVGQPLGDSVSGPSVASDGSFGPVASSVTVVDNTVYVGTTEGTLHALDAWTGRQRWQFDDPEGPLFSSPTVHEDTVYVGSDDETLYAVDATTGERDWSFNEPDGPVASSPTVHDDTVYVGSEDETLYAVGAANGTFEWAFSELPSEGPEDVFSSPTVAGGTVYVGSEDSAVYGIDAETGRETATFDTPTGSVRSSPVVVDGTLYVGANDGALYAFDTAGSATSEGSRVQQGTLGHTHPCPELRLEDSDDDCIPDAVAEADLQMPDDGSDAAGDPINLDPTERDTSGNGIHDHRLIDVEWEVVDGGADPVVEAEVTDAIANPSRVDSTGDGLTDREQLRGWEIAYTESEEASRRLFKAIGKADDGEDSALGAIVRARETYMTTEWVTTDPLRNDTDGDLADIEERKLGTHPRKVDTTGDEAKDVDAGLAGYDPTIFEKSPPKIDIYGTDFNKPSGSWDGNYTVTLDVQDPRGLREVRLVKDGNVEKRVDVSGEHFSGEMYIDTGEVETILDLFTGATLLVEAENENGANSTKFARQQKDIFGILTERLSEKNLTTAEVEFRLAVMSGMTTGAGESLEAIRYMITDPEAYIEDTLAVVNQIENLPELIAAYPGTIQTKQKQNNIHDPGDEGYENYRDGWYAGYTFWFVVEMIQPGGQISRAIKSTDKFQDLASSLSKTRIGQAARFAQRAADKGKAPVRISRYHLSRGIKAGLGFSGDGGRRIVGGVDSVGQQIRVAKRLHRSDVDRDAIEGLSDGEKRELGESLARHRDGNSNFVIKGNDGTSRVVVPEEIGTTQWRFQRAYEEGDIDSSELETVQHRYDELDADGKHEFDDLLERNGDDTVEFAARSDSDTFDAVVSPCGTRGAPSLNGAVALGTDRYYSVEAQPSSLAQSGGSCPDLPDDLEDDLRESLIDLDWSKLDDGDLETADVRRMRELLESGEMDQADVRRLTEIIESRDRSELFDDNIVAADLTGIGDRGDLSSTQLVAKDGNGNTRWLEQGRYDPDGAQKDTGWSYLEGRHIEGRQLNDKEATDFWPVGQSVGDETLPNTMSRRDIRESVYQAVKDTKTTEQDAFNYDGFSSEFVEQTGVESIRVVIRNGRVRTAYPKRGPSVWKYVSENDVGWIK